MENEGFSCPKPACAAGGLCLKNTSFPFQTTLPGSEVKVTLKSGESIIRGSVRDM